MAVQLAGALPSPPASQLRLLLAPTLHAGICAYFSPGAGGSLFKFPTPPLQYPYSTPS